MSTVVYDGKILASDSQCTFYTDTIEYGEVKKFYYNKNTVVSGTGILANVQFIAEWILKHKEDPDMKPYFVDNDPQCTILVIDRRTKKCYKYETDKLIKRKVASPYAIGSGYELAMGALNAMKLLKLPYDAKMAVKAAIMSSTGSSGKIQYIEV